MIAGGNEPKCLDNELFNHDQNYPHEDEIISNTGISNSKLVYGKFDL